VSTDRDVERIVRSWLDEGVTQLPDRVLDLVLDQIPTTSQRRAGWPAWRSSPMITYARVALGAVVVVVAALLAINLLPRTGVGGPDASPSSTASAADPLDGTWAAPTTTCEQQNATIEAAGFTAEQISLSAWSCQSGLSNQYSVRFWTPLEHSLMTIMDGTEQASQTDYRIVDDQTFEAFIPGDPFCMPVRYTIDGDKLTMDVGKSCNSTGNPQWNDQVALTAILETSSFTRQP
jgi:hypothetical protein